MAHGQPDAARVRMGEAAALFQAQEMGLHAAVARRRQGVLLGGDEGRALVAEADAWMAGQQVRNPARLAAVLAPGFPS